MKSSLKFCYVFRNAIARIKLDGTVDNTHTHTHTHTDTHTRAHTHTRTHARKGIISFIIFKRKVNEGKDEWFKLMTNLIHECIGVIAHLIRIWKTEFHCNQGLLPISIQRFSLFTSAKSRRRTMC